MFISILVDPKADVRALTPVLTAPTYCQYRPGQHCSQVLKQSVPSDKHWRVSSEASSRGDGAADAKVTSTVQKKEQDA